MNLRTAGEVTDSREYQQNIAYGGGLAPGLPVGFIAGRTAAQDVKQ